MRCWGGRIALSECRARVDSRGLVGGFSVTVIESGVLLISMALTVIEEKDIRSFRE